MGDRLIRESVQHVVEVLRERGTLGYLAGKSECGGIEQPPRRLVTPVMLRPFPLVQYVPDPLHAYDVLTVHREDGMVRRPVVQRNTPVAGKPLVLPDTLLLQRLHDLGEETGQ